MLKPYIISVIEDAKRRSAMRAFYNYDDLSCYAEDYLICSERPLCRAVVEGSGIQVFHSA